MYEVADRHDGRRIIFPVLILASSPSFDLTGLPARALLDTGATNSGIAPRVIDALGLEPYGKRPLGYARGEEQVARYMIRVGFSTGSGDGVSSLPFIFDEVDAFELRNSFAFEALIGMDILHQCDLTLLRDGSWSLRFGRG